MNQNMPPAQPLIGLLLLHGKSHSAAAAEPALRTLQQAVERGLEVQPVLLLALEQSILPASGFEDNEDRERDFMAVREVLGVLSRRSVVRFVAGRAL